MRRHSDASALIARQAETPARDRPRPWGHQLGLKGSGSHNITIEGACIPDYLALPSVHISAIDVSEGSRGENPDYQFWYGDAAG